MGRWRGLGGGSRGGHADDAAAAVPATAHAGLDASAASVGQPGGETWHAGSADLSMPAWLAREEERDRPVPRWLEAAAGWSWRLLVLGVVLYAALKIASMLRLVMLPGIAALLLTGLLYPIAQRLRQAGLPGVAAAWLALLAAIAVLAGAATLAVTQINSEYPTLVHDVSKTAQPIQRWLAGPPLHLRHANLQQLSSHLLLYLKQHESAVAGTVVTGGKVFLEVLAGLGLMMFVTFFLLKDGERIWAWLTSALGPRARHRAEGAGLAAWEALTYYVRGTIVVAVVHAVVIGLALWILGVPLLVPLVILVFLAAFVPLVGILVAGTLAVTVTLGTHGWLDAVILVAILIAENQLESHLLQPVVVGRMVRLHPLAIILVLAVGGIVGGIPGAVIAVPTAAALVRAVPYLRGLEPGAVTGAQPDVAPGHR